MTPAFPEYIALFIFGTAIGSFLNVVIYRIPAGLSIVKPGSHCPHCNRPIKAYENIPILSYMFLLGRCAGCRSRISIRYPLVECSMGILAVLMLANFGWSWDLLIYSILAALLLSLTLIDLDVYRLPNAITLTGSIFAVVLTLLFRRSFFLEMILGGLVGIGVLSLQGLVGTMIVKFTRKQKKSALGLGDVKLAGMIGLFLGPGYTAGMFILGIFLATIFSVFFIVSGKRAWTQRIPFGPYLAGGALISLFWGKDLWAWYWSFL